MKVFALTTALLILSLPVLTADDDLSNFSSSSASNTNGQDLTGYNARTAPALEPRTTKAFPNPNVRLKPRLGGIFVDGAKHGTVLISPTAPAEYGKGEKYLSAPSTRDDLKHESGPAAHRDAGGFKLFSLEF